MFKKRPIPMLLKNQNMAQTFPDTAWKKSKSSRILTATPAEMQETAQMHLKIFPGMITICRHMIPFPSCTFNLNSALSLICRAVSRHTRTRLTHRKLKSQI